MDVEGSVHWSNYDDCSSAIEQEPALLIAQPLVVKHEFTDLAWKLFTLSLAL